MQRFPHIAPILFAAMTLHAAVPDATHAQGEPVPVAGKVYMLNGRGGNMGISVGPDGILLIDDKFAPMAEDVRKSLRSLSRGPLRFILNTHWHGDHTGGNKIFGREAPIIAHANVRKRLTTKQFFLGREIPPMPKEAWPVVTFDRSLSIHFNGEEIKALHLPNGHTDGDTVAFFTGSNVVHLGDLFFAGRYPFVDLDHGGDVEGVIANIGRMIRRIPKDAKIIPGHGSLSTLKDLKAYHRALSETTEIVRKGMQAGKPLQAIQQEGLPARYDAWSRGYISTERWIATVHRSLSRN